MPAGKVVDHDRVVTHTHGDPERALTFFTNIGDCFVFESSLRILAYSELVPIYVPADGEISERQIEKINSLDYVFLRGSNYIHTNGKWDPYNRVFKHIKVPVIAFGIGVQTPDKAKEYVNESTRRFLCNIGDRSASVAVRGELSAEVLRSIGIDNIRIISCPTAFRHRKSALRLRRVPSDAIDRLGFSLRRKTYGCATVQRYLLRTLSEQYRLTILCAGELEEKAIHYASRDLVSDASAVMSGALDRLMEDGWIYGPEDPIVGLYRDRMGVFESVDEFEQEVRRMSAVTGFRLHGNLMALANEIPALYVTYDTRTREFVQALRIPSVESRQMDRFSFRRAWDAADFDAFEAAYRSRYEELRAFLAENHMAHRLDEPGEQRHAAE